MYIVDSFLFFLFHSLSLFGKQINVSEWRRRQMKKKKKKTKK